MPAILLEPDRAARSKRNMIQAFVAAGVSIFFLAGGLVTYLFVNGSPMGASAPEQVEVEVEEVTMLDHLQSPVGQFWEGRG